MDERQTANFRAYLAQMGIRGAGGETLTAEQAAELLRMLSRPRNAPQPGGDSTFTAADPDVASTPMFAAAVGFHEFFRVLTAAGFTEDQALKYMAYASQGGGSAQ